MTKYESETVITFNDEESEATIYTCNKSWQNRLSKLCQNSPCISLIKQDEYSRT